VSCVLKSGRLPLPPLWRAGGRWSLSALARRTDVVNAQGESINSDGHIVYVSSQPFIGTSPNSSSCPKHTPPNARYQLVNLLTASTTPCSFNKTMSIPPTIAAWLFELRITNPSRTLSPTSPILMAKLCGISRSSHIPSSTSAARKSRDHKPSH
jgi:hypothetical protein